MPHPRLPQEVINLIVIQIWSSIPEPDVPFTILRACCLASTAFRDPCQSIIFSQILIGVPYKANNRLRVVLSSSPRLSAFVKQATTMVSTSNCSLVQTLLICLQMHTLTLSAWGNMGETAGVNDLLRLLQYSPIRELHLHGIQKFPLEILQLCSHLQILDISRGTRCVLHPSEHNIGRNSVYLRKLVLHDPIPPPLDPTFPLSLSRIQKVDFNLTGPGALFFQSILDHTASHLEALHLKFSTFYPSWVLFLIHIATSH